MADKPAVTRGWGLARYADRVGVPRAAACVGPLLPPLEVMLEAGSDTALRAWPDRLAWEDGVGEYIGSIQMGQGWDDVPIGDQAAPLEVARRAVDIMRAAGSTDPVVLVGAPMPPVTLEHERMGVEHG